MTLFFDILGFALFVFWLLLIARVVVEFIRGFSRDWQPRGLTVVILEVIMTVTDPPVKHAAVFRSGRGLTATFP